MGFSLSRRTIMYEGEEIPVIGVLGPSGEGKSLLAKKMAQIITRAETAPDVLLVDGDVYSRGPTAEMEEIVFVDCNKPTQVGGTKRRQRRDASKGSPNFHEKACNLLSQAFQDGKTGERSQRK